VLNLTPRDPLHSDGTYPQRAYLRDGLALMALKYAVDFLVIWLVTGTIWTPFDYILSLASLHGARIASFPSLLNLWLLVWCLPFICIGIVLSVRRAKDAALPPWLVVAFFVPLLNYLMIGVLLVAPTAPAFSATVPALEEPEAQGHSWRGLLVGVFSGLVAGTLCVWVGVEAIRTYGVTMFFATPFVIGMSAAFAANLLEPRERSAAMRVVVAAIGAIAAGLLLFAIEGLVCMVMAAPIAVPLALLGGVLGHSLARTERSAASLGLVVLMIPAGHAIDRGVQAEPSRLVVSSIEVEAPRPDVWRHVITFDEITSPLPWYFRTGLAYPIRARIDGYGVDAVRFCEFSTGAFEEPISAWEEPSLLAFDVTRQPAPLQEWSPYRNLYTHHLHGFFKTTKGEFRLIAIDAQRTRLEGRTWYSIRMQPQGYWTAISDAIVHRVHARVLSHIKAQAEGAAPARQD
jgi:hypothetical protein